MIGEDQYLLALDIGTTAIKVGLFSTSGALVRMESREQQIITPKPGWAEQSPDMTWNLIGDAVRTINHSLGGVSVAAIALSVQRGTVVPLNKNGVPVSNLIVWMDNRGLPQVDWAIDKVGLDETRSISGSGISYISGDSKSLWIKREAPEIWSQAAVIGTPQTLFLKLLGCEEFICDHSSGCSHFPQDIQRKQWSSELAEVLEFPILKLPRLVSAVEIVGGLSPKAAEHLGLKAGIPLVAGGGDGQCAGAGSGVLETGLCMINYGTGTGVQVYLTEPNEERPAGFSCLAHVDPKAWEMEGHTQASGVVLRWFRDQFGQLEKNLAGLAGLDAFDLLVDQALQVRPGADGLLFMPFFNGCTAPIPDPNLRSSFLGLRLEHSRSHLLRALLEGIALEIRWMLETIESSGAPVNEIRLVGGGAINPFLNQLHANLMDRRIVTTCVKDAAPVGAAMCAATAVGAYRDLQEASEHFVEIERAFEPDERWRDIYNRLFENFKNAYGIFHESDLFQNMRAQQV